MEIKMKSKYYLTAFLALAAGLIIFTASLMALPAEDAVNSPDGYTKICSIKMSEAHMETSVYEFKLDAAAQEGFYIWTDAKVSKKLRIEGSNNTIIELLSGAGSINSSEFKLEPGTYRLLLTNEQASGELLIYMKEDR
jgi:hypothetical protein